MRLTIKLHRVKRGRWFPRWGYPAGVKMRPRNSSRVAYLGRASAALAAYNFTFQENSMKSLQRLCALIALTLVLTLTAFAGEMSTGAGSAPPPPPPPPQSSMMDGQMETPLNADEASNEATSLSPGAEIGLSLLQSVLALF
jgi:hypothetical protein